MTDRELLELAAKACGKEIDLDRYGDEMGFIILGISRWWNPLTNDGDAFRLMVKLEIDVCISPEFNAACAWCPPISDYMETPLGSDPVAATRRAITRAAAAIQEAREAA